MRMRVVFATDESVKYVGHLDLARAWERAIRRARLPLSYSQGYNPQPRIQFAAALPVGFTGISEVLDVYLDEELEPDRFVRALEPALPRGIHLISAAQVPPELPSLQSLVCGATYRVEVATDETSVSFCARLDGFLSRSSAWRERRRGDKLTHYDLRPLVETLCYSGPCQLGQAFETKMRSEPGATGRPDELLAEMGFDKTSRRIERRRLIFADGEAARGCGSSPTTSRVLGP
jgi:radical SAM-linked protein